MIDRGPASPRQDSEALRLAIALIGVPNECRGDWLSAQTVQRAAEARALGADEALAGVWAAAWSDFVRELIASTELRPDRAIALSES